MKANLFIIACKDHARLRTTLEGVLWSDLLGIDNVVIVVNDCPLPRGRATQAVKDVATEFLQIHDIVKLLVFDEKSLNNTSGRGQALWWAFHEFPGEFYIKLDDDMFPITRDWPQRLVRSVIVKGTDLAVAMTNMNGLCAKRFVEYLGENWHDYSQDQRILYMDAAAQFKVWEATVAHWDKVLGWNDTPRLVELANLKANHIVNANAYCFRHGWLSRRTLDHFAVVGEDERALNAHVRGDDDAFAFDHEALLLHWGFTAAKGMLSEIWPDVLNRLHKHWGLA